MGMKDISQQKKLVNFSKFPIQHYVTGIKKVRSLLLEQLEITEDILHTYLRKLIIVSLLLLKKKIFVIAESRVSIKNQILKIKKIISEDNSPIIELFKILLLELIGTEKVLKPFWNSQCKKNSEQLWLPTEIDSADSLLNSYSGYWKPMEQNSWFSMKQFLPMNKNLQTTFCQSSTFSLVKKWENGGTKKTNILGCRKILLNPTKEQQDVFKKWMGASRYTYNQTVHKINNEKQKVNFYNLRNKLVPKEKIISSRKWLLDTPKDIRANTIRECVTMYKSAFSNLKNGNIKKFHMNYRSRKQWFESIHIPKTAIKVSACKRKINIYNSYLKTSIIIKNEKELPNIDHEVTLFHNKKNSSWYLCILIDHKVKSENQGGTVSIDPGVKSFLTLYDPKGQVVQFGTNDMKNKLKNIYLKIDKYKSLLYSKNKLCKRRLRKRIMYYNNKFHNLILEIHNKACRYIYKNYNNVLISNISSVRSCKKNNRNLLSWNHGKFLERLKHHMHKHGKKINIVTEEYTSKTCGNCGNIDEQLSNKDIYMCKCCNLKIGRDVNGARNILLKHLK